MQHFHYVLQNHENPYATILSPFRAPLGCCFLHSVHGLGAALRLPNPVENGPTAPWSLRATGLIWAEHNLGGPPVLASMFHLVSWILRLRRSHRSLSFSYSCEVPYKTGQLLRPCVCNSEELCGLLLNRHIQNYVRDFVPVHVICVFFWGKVLELSSGSQRHHAQGCPCKFSCRLRHFGRYKGEVAGIQQELSVLEQVITTDWKPGLHGVYTLMGIGGPEEQ